MAINDHAYLLKTPNLAGPKMDSISKYEILDCKCNYESDEVVQLVGDDFFVKVKKNNGQWGYILLKNTSVFLEKNIIVKLIGKEWKIVEYNYNVGC